MAVVGKGSRTALSNRTAQGTEDVNFTLPNNSDPIILGTGVGDDNGNRMRMDDGVTLQFRTGAGSFVTVNNSTGAVRMTTATSLTNDNALTEGERLSTGLFDAFVDGREVEDDGASTQANQVRDETTEFQWGLDFSNAATSTTYDFRVQWVNDDATDNINYISITTAGVSETVMVADTVGYTITGTAVGLAQNLHVIVAASASYAITGTATPTLKTSVIVADTAGYTITGTAVGLAQNLHVMVADTNSYSITGTDVTTSTLLTTMAADTVAYSITGTNVTTAKISELTMIADKVSYVIAGTAVSLRKTVNIMLANTVAYIITGTAVNLTFTPLGGRRRFVISG